MKTGDNRFEAFVREQGGRLTPQRQYIVREFLSLRGHFDVQELHRHFQDKGKQIDPSTIFRTLKLLVQADIASERQFGNGKTKFEVNTQHHDHLICVDCGSIVEFSSDRMEALQNRIAGDLGFEVQYHKHEIYGHCGRCRKTPRSPRATRRPERGR